MEALQRFTDVVTRLLMIVGGVALFAMMLHITADVFFKYAFNSPIVGTLEIVARYYMVLVVFLPIAFVQLSRQHLMVEVFTLSLPPRYVAFLDGVVAIVGIVYSAILTWLVLGQAIDQTARREFYSITYFDLPTWPSRWVLPISFALLCVVMVLQSISDLRRAFAGPRSVPVSS